MLVNSSINRFASATNYPSQARNSIALVTDVSAPGSAYQNSSYGMNGLGSTVLDDITSLNFASLPGDVVTGLGTGDYGSYLVVGALALLLVPMFLGGNSKTKSRAISRRAQLKGAIARESELLKGV